MIESWTHNGKVCVHCCVCALGWVNAEHKFWVWVTILGCMSLHFHSLFWSYPNFPFTSSSAWISTAVVKMLVTQNANPGWWRRMRCPAGSWRMTQRWKGSPVKKRRRRCSAVAPVKEKKWTTATPSQRNNGWRWMRNRKCFVLNLWL